MTFDRLKIITNIKNISYINKNDFEKKMKNGRIVGWRYKQETPFLLLIEKDNSRKEIVIEFTAKILEERYPELINSGNIKKCLETINELSICKLKVDSILEDATVVKCDVTRDVVYNDLKGLTLSIRAGIKNYNRYSCRLDGNNLTITNNVSTRNRKIRLVIYDKAKEMRRSENASCRAKTGFDIFNGKIRFEMNLTSMAQIRQRLKVEDTTLMSVLNSSATPIIDFFNDILADKTGGTDVKTLREYERMLLLESCGFDLDKVEAIARKHSSPKVSVKQLMKPYRELFKNYNGESKDIRAILNQLLSS